MNEEQRKQIDALNAKYFTEFGIAPDGRLKYRWMRTDEMPIEFGRECEMKLDQQSGLWIASRTYKRRTFAETYGQGLCWTIAYLEPAVPHSVWLAKHGTAIPWPSNGYYRPVDCIALHIDTLPDDDISIRAAFNIRTALGIFSKGVEATNKEDQTAVSSELGRRNESLRKEVADMIDDATPAFQNNPGGKSHVSLPS